ncbi:MAG TPA: amino acid adenylation domain-containing protein, partial [Thermoanaerobaculia bacterium]|nr:amino acid adenylation domain-containing protein [Thermoanaerobaculia bacterium]
ALAAYEHQEMPLAVLAERLLPERDPARSPLFDVVFAFEKGRETRLDLCGFALGMPGSRLRLGEAVLSSVAFPPPGAPFALSLVAAELGRGLGASLRFNTDLFDRATVVRLAERLGRLLAAVAAAPERRLSELPLLAPAERHQLLVAWNDTARDYPRDAGLAELFAAAAARAPEAVALIMDPGPAVPRELRLQYAVDAPGAGLAVMTYGELERAANRLANHLAARGVRAEDRVAVCLPRSPRLIVALLACVKAGAAYVPLDPAYPAERLAWLLADSGAAAVVTAGEAGAALPAHGCVKVGLDDLEGDAGLSARSKAASFVGSVGSVGSAGVRGGGGAERLFCLLYTSGSTGRPKAVALVHRGVARLALGGGHARLGPDRVLAHLAPITFDAATFEIWCALANGARLVILPPGVPSLDGLGTALARHRVTTLFLTTALFHEMVEQNLAGLAGVEELFTGGDVVSLAHLERAAAALPGTRLFDAYGPTEDTTYATCWPVVPGGAAGAPPIGRPVAATEAFVLDRAGGLVPQGSACELALAGDGLARGYWNQPALTAERFRPHPFSRRGGERVYLTGDSVRHRSEGNLQFLGRVDRQVKVRGFRVEPGEIEAALATHPGVAQSIAVVREDRPGDKRLVVYAVPRAGESAPGAPDAPDAAELRRHLAARLPAYMLPTSLVVLAALPVTAHGKVDRRALPAPAPGAAGTEPDSGGGVPRTPLEVILAGIWQEVLGMERVGLDDNFFALGGHSLLAARLMSRVRRAFGVELPLAVLFEEPTLAGLAARLAGALAAGDAAPAGLPPNLPAPHTQQIPPQARPDHPPLSFSQERLWFLDQLEPGSVSYSIPAALRLQGELAWAPLAGALTGIVGRHEVLRTRFPEVEGQPVQRVEPPAPVALPVVDLARLGATAAAAESARLAAVEAAAPFGLAAGPPLRARLLTLGAGEWLLLLSFHHIVFDGASVEVFWRELGTLYAAIQSHRGREPHAPLAMRPPAPPALPPLPIQYLDYTLWQRRQLSGPALAPLVDFWRQALAGAPPALALPTDRPRPAVRGSRGGRRLLAPAPGLAAAVAALARHRDATSFMVLLAAWAALLGRAGGARGPGAPGGHSAVVVGAPFANRDRLELEPLIGFFVNTLPVPIDLAGDPAFGELLGRVRQAALAAYAHQELPFEKLVEKLSPERDPSSTPLFQAVLAFRDREAASPGLPGVRAELLPPVLPRAKFDLMLELASGPQGLGGDLEYSAELFDAATAERLLGQFTRLLATAAAAPQRRISELPLLAAAERHQLLAAWNDTAREYPRDAGLAALFAAAAARAPEAVALVCGERQLSYCELGRRADAMAERLVSLGVAPEVVVGVCLERSLELVVALLGVLKAGGAYLPLEPAWPAERLALLLAGAGAPVLVTDGTGGAAGLAAVAGAGSPVVIGVAERPGQGAPEAGPLAGQGPADASAKREQAARSAWRGDGDSLAYVSFTSGSTGEPKGVAVVQRGVARLVLGAEHARFGPEQVWLQLAPTAFDASTLEIWGPLLNGGKLVIYPPRAVSPEELGELLAAQQVSSLWLTAGLFHQMAEANVAGLAPLEQLLAGGDALSPAAVRRTLAALPGCRLINGYGPTEVTTFTCCQTLGVAGLPATVPAGTVPIGRPIANTRAYLLDAALHPVPVGVVGELCAGGDGLARGYHRRPALTAERFVPDPCGGEPGGRLYRTGDLARYLADGRMEFLGRLDAQLKVRGVRVEPAEVEAALVQHPGLAAAAVVATTRPSASASSAAGERWLVAYVVAAGEGQAPAAEELRAFLRRRLPEPMLPSAFVVLPALPLTANGKLDRQALPAPSWGRDERQEIALPRTPAEELLAGIWREVLGVERVGLHDSFFALGGHSLLAARLMSRVRRAFGVELPLGALFAQPTLAGLAARLAGALAGGGDLGAPVAASGPIEPWPRPAQPPLSFAQERLWYLDQLEPASVTYNVPAALRLRGDLAWAPLAGAITAIVARHEALRTRFPEIGGQPVQRVEPPAVVPLPVVDLTRLPAAVAATESVRLTAAEAAAPFALAAGPLLRARLLAIAAGEWLLLLSFHHIVFDGVSVEVFWRELGTFYAALRSRGSEAPAPLAPLPALPPLPIQYLDYTLWQRQRLVGPVLEPLLAFWRQALAEAPPALAMATDRPRPAVRGSRGGRRLLPPAPGIAEAVAALAQRQDTTSFMVLLAAWAALLGRAGAGAQSAVVVGSPAANRDRLELEPLIGFFVNALPLPIDLAGDPAFGDLLARVRWVALAAYAHQELPFERMVQELAPQRDPGATPLFQAMLVFREREAASPGLPGVRAELLPPVLPRAKFDLTLSLAGGPEGLAGDLEYSAELFDAATAERLLGHFSRLLAAAAAAPERRLSELPLMAPAEHHQLLWGWNDVSWDYPRDATLGELFAVSVARAPDAIALVMEPAAAAPQAPPEVMTYGELDRAANGLANHLAALGVRAEDRVAVCLPRSPRLIVALLACVKAGAGYVPLDPSYPEERLAWLLADSGAAAVITAGEAGAALPADGCAIVDLDRLDRAAAAIATATTAAGAAGLFCLLYTSGSTGTPKAVALVHRGVARLALGSGHARLGPDRVFAHLAPITFDAATFE